MYNKMAIAAVVVIVVALAAFGTYIIYSDDGADDGIEVPVSQPSVGDFITTKMTEPDGTVWVFHFDDMGDIEVGGDSDVTDTKTVMGEEMECSGYTTMYPDGTSETTWYNDRYFMPVINEQHDADGTLLVTWNLFDTNSDIGTA